MIDVEITNYRSIAHAKIAIEGFTALVGRNFLGKSNLLRAINSALTNEQGTSFIRWGESYCEVHIVMEGMDLLWHKEESNNYYVINGVTYSKIGGGDPPKVVADAGFKEIAVGSSWINLNYAEQYFPLFLLDKRDSKGIDLLTSVYGLDRLYDAVSLCNKEQNDTNDLLRLREKDLELINRDLERFSNFDEAKKFVGSVKENKEKLDDKDEELSDLIEKNQQIDLISNQCKRLKTVHTIALPDVSKIHKKIGVYQKLCEYQERVQSLAVKLKVLKPVSEIVTPGDKVKDIQERIQSHKKLVLWERALQELSSSVDRLSPVSKVTLPKITFNVDVIKKIKDYISLVETHKQGYLSLKKQIEAATAELTKITEERSTYKTCPLCGGTL